MPRAVSTTTHIVQSKFACTGIKSCSSCHLDKDAEHTDPPLGPNLVLGMSKMSSAPLSTVKPTLTNLEILVEHGHGNSEFIGVNGRTSSVKT